MEPLVHKSPFSILKTTYNTILVHPVILYPFCLLALLQLLVLEILFFAPRPPLSHLFAPLLQAYPQKHMEYPYNFVLLSNWFNSVQIPLYIFLNSFFLGATVLIINYINEDRPIDLRKIFQETFSRYIYLVLAALLSVFLIMKVNGAYHVFARDALMSPTLLMFFRKLIVHGDGLVQLFISILITTLLAFIVPLIIIEKKNFLQALVLNFKYQTKTMKDVLILVLLPGLLYVPVSLLKLSWKNPDSLAVPEFLGLLAIGGMLILLFIEAIQYAAVTTYYLFQQGK